MKTNSNTPAAFYEQFGIVGRFLRWSDEHPRTASALLWLQAAALFYFAFTYNFTTTL